MTSYQESDAASREDESRSALGCLIPAIAATIAVAVAITLVSWMFLGDDEAGDGEPTGTDEAASAQASEAEEASEDARPSIDALLGDVDEPDHPTVSTQALIEVVQSGGWIAFGQPEVIDLSSQQRLTRKFRRDDEHIAVTILTHKSLSGADTVVKTTKPPAQVVSFGYRVVVVEPLTDGAKPMVTRLVGRLRKFRDLLDDQDDAP